MTKAALIKLLESFRFKSEAELLQQKDFYATSDAPPKLKDIVIEAIDSVLNKEHLRALASAENCELKLDEM